MVSPVPSPQAPDTVEQLNLAEAMVVRGGQAMITSVAIAGLFRREHQNVLTSIERDLDRLCVASAIGDALVSPCLVEPSDVSMRSADDSADRARPEVTDAAAGGRLKNQASSDSDDRRGLQENLQSCDSDDPDGRALIFQRTSRSDDPDGRAQIFLRTSGSDDGSSTPAKPAAPNAANRRRAHVRVGEIEIIRTTYRNRQGKGQPMFLLNEAACSLVVLPFTGARAFAHRLTIVNGFYQMRQVLERRRSAEWQLQRAEGKVARTDMTDALQRLEAYARAHGSTHAGWFYVQYTKLLYRELFICLDLPPGALRDALDRRQLAKLRTGEMMVADLIDELIAAGVHYKSIYDQVKQRVRTYADVVGRSTVLAPSQPQLALGPATQRHLSN